LGIQLEYVSHEVSVGSFRADIQARDDEGNAVVIENQYNQTNHEHLGKMLTYAAGLDDVKTAVWITESVREEHRAAIDWLNDHTDEDMNFFLVRVKLVQIGDSNPAPLFQVEAKPNQWTKQTKQQAGVDKSELTGTKIANLQFFETLVGQGSDAPWSWQTPRAQHWFDISIGTSGVRVSVTLRKGKGLNKANDVQIEYHIDDDKDFFDKVEKFKPEVESQLGPLDWMRLDDKKASRIVKNLQIDWMDDDAEARASEVLVELVPFYQVFREITTKVN